MKDVILYGTRGEKLELHYDQPRGKGVLYQAFEGICNNLERRYQETQSDASKKELEELHDPVPLPGLPGPPPAAGGAGGHRGRPVHLRIRHDLPVDDALDFFDASGR